jgi:hypothetical protein
MRRRESERERTLLRLIERQEARIERLENKLMYLCNRPWELPNEPLEPIIEQPDEYEVPELQVIDEAI